MHFPNHRDDSSSDDSDVVFPQTPAAKSTPFPPASRLRKQSSSSNSSSNGGPSQIHKMTSRTAADSDSSSADESRHHYTPIFRSANMKQEAETDSSSDDEDNQQSNGRREPSGSCLRSARSVHAMSDSDDSDEQATTVQQKQSYQQNESHEDSDDDDATKHSKAIVVKTEKASTTEGSEEESDNEVTTPALQNVSAAAQDSEDSSSSSDDETARCPQQKQDAETSSNDSEDEEDQQKPVTAMADDSDDDLDSETSNPLVSNVLPKTIQNMPSKFSNESSDEDEGLPCEQTWSNLQILQHRHNKDKELTDEEDINVPSKYMPSSHLSSRPLCKPSEESSDDEEAVASKTIFTQQSNQTNSKTVYYDSSEEEELSDKKSDEEVYEKKFNINDASNCRIESIPEPSKEVSFKEQNLRVVPSSGKYGTALLEETFRGSDHMQVQNACLTIEDIGSDDEIWLFQCPKSMDIASLKKKSINLVTDSDIQLEDGPTFKRFSVMPRQNVNISVNCLLPCQNQNIFQISSLPVEGTVVIQEHIHAPKLRLPKANLKGPVPFPTGLKVRHPLLGIGFEEHIAQSKRTLQENALCRKQNSKKRKRSSGNIHPREICTGADAHNQSLQSSTLINGKKTKEIVSNDGSKDKWSDKKEKKTSLGENESFTNSFKNSSVDGSFLNNTFAKKQKKSKKDKEGDGKSFQLGLDTSFNDDGYSKGKKKISSSPEKKKIKSPKDVQNERGLYQNLPQNPRPTWHIPQSDEVPVTVLSEKVSPPQSKKKKHSKELLLPSEIKQEISASFHINRTSNVQGLETVHSKKRKRKEIDERGNAVDSSKIPSKKKKYSV